MKDYLQIIIGLSSLFVIIFVIVICFVLNNKYKKFVLANSDKIKELELLNKQTIFHESIKSEYYFKKSLNSKRKLDNTSIEKYFIGLIESNFESFNNIVNKINANILKYKVYQEKYQVIKSTATEEFCKNLKTRYKKFIRYENSLFRNLLIEPILDTEITVELTYTSPKGRNFYNKYDVYDFHDFVDIFNKTTTLIENKQTRQYQIQIERAKMSDSLRYDILKRDNFRCQICGISAQEGAKLHVDHIVPVSKGGKTEPSNLRTLCERCNMGKSDKIE